MFLRRIVDGKAFLLGRNVRKDGWMGGGQILRPDRREHTGDVHVRVVFKRDNAERF